ncbi:MAG: ZIP family metal transporter [Bacteroidota bacterium]
MILNLVVLLLSVLIPGLVAFRIPEVDSSKLKLSLVFAGSYLFSITIIHILPELFASKHEDATIIGLLVLVGFLMQQVLEFFSSGVEHGHMHKKDKHHHHNPLSSFYVLIALSIHALLEGTLLAHPSTAHGHHDSTALLVGIALHKGPAAFAFMSILLCQFKKRRRAIAYLLVFSIMSPLGLFISDYLFEESLLADQAFTYLFAIVGGNFLYISTIIFFETSPEHRFNGKRMLVSMIGVAFAVLAELLV